MKNKREKIAITAINTMTLLGLLILAWGNVLFFIAMDVNPFGWPLELLALAAVSATAAAIHYKIKIKKQ